MAVIFVSETLLLYYKCVEYNQGLWNTIKAMIISICTYFKISML